MKTLLLYLLFAYLVLSVQAIFFNQIKPDLIIVLICSYSLKYGQVRGMTYGALSGLLIDTVCGFILGPHTLSKAITGFLIGTVKDHLFHWNIYINTLVVAVCSVFNVLCVYLIFETFSSVSFANRPLEISVMEIIYTLIASLVFYPVLGPVHDKEAFV